MLYGHWTKILTHHFCFFSHFRSWVTITFSFFFFNTKSLFPICVAQVGHIETGLRLAREQATLKCQVLLHWGCPGRGPLEHTPTQSLPNMLSGWHVGWVRWSCRNWAVFCFCGSNRNMRWCLWKKDTTMGLRISSRHLCAFKTPSIKCTCVRCMPAHTLIHSLDSSKTTTPTRCHARCLSPATCTENQDYSVKRTQRARVHRMWAFSPLKVMTKCHQVKTLMNRKDSGNSHVPDAKVKKNLEQI